jgi:hypothetical protein
MTIALHSGLNFPLRLKTGAPPNWWAFYSLWFLTGGKARRSIVVEPDPKDLSVGEANTRLNGLTPMFIQAFICNIPGLPLLFKTAESGRFWCRVSAYRS